MSNNHALLKRKPRPPRWKPRRWSVRNASQGRRAIVRKESVRKESVRKESVRKEAAVRRDKGAKVEDNGAKVAQGREIAKAGAAPTADGKVAVGIVVTTDETTGVAAIADASKVHRKSTSRS